jgi:soluble lytic murein transglycosylase-like protein
MLTAPILIPLTTKSFFNDNQLPMVRTKLAEIKKAYGIQIAQASSITGVGEDLITAVIFIESGGKAGVISPSGAVGLMQVSPGAADSGIYLMIIK